MIAVSMNTEAAFNVIFWTLLILMFLMRFWFAFRVWRTGERLLPDRAAREREGFWALNLDRLFSLLFVVVVLLWFQGNSLRSLAFPAPDWIALGQASGLGSSERGTICSGRMWPWGGFGPPACNFGPTTG